VGAYLIIENDNSTINSIKKVLKDFPEYNCLGIISDYNKSLNLILKKTPNIIFFNIDNIIINPFQFLNEVNQLQDASLEFIALSSSLEKAYKAIKNGFFDSLIKPLIELEIRKTILKFQKKNKIKSRSTICLKSYKDFQYLDTKEVLFLKADNNTTDFYMKDGNCINAFKTLKIFEKLLPDNFLRIHKSYIINSNYVSRINFGKLLCTVKRNIYIIPFTKTYIENVEIMNKALTETSFLLN